MYLLIMYFSRWWMILGVLAGRGNCTVVGHGWGEVWEGGVIYFYGYKITGNTEYYVQHA